MEKSRSLPKKRTRDNRVIPNRIDDLFENFRTDIENIFSPLSSSIWDMRVPRLGFPDYADIETRMPLCDIIDKGDKYEVLLEVPGIDKEKIKINAKENSVIVEGEHTKRIKEKADNYIHHERSFQSFQREIPFPEEIIPSNAEAEIKGGILQLSIPKKEPKKKEDTEIVNIKVK